MTLSRSLARDSSYSSRSRQRLLGRRLDRWFCRPPHLGSGKRPPLIDHSCGKGASSRCFSSAYRTPRTVACMALCGRPSVPRPHAISRAPVSARGCRRGSGRRSNMRRSAPLSAENAPMPPAQTRPPHKRAISPRRSVDHADGTVVASVPLPLCFPNRQTYRASLMVGMGFKSDSARDLAVSPHRLWASFARQFSFGS